MSYVDEFKEKFGETTVTLRYAYLIEISFRGTIIYKEKIKAIYIKDDKFWYTSYDYTGKKLTDYFNAIRIKKLYDLIELILQDKIEYGN